MNQNDRSRDEQALVDNSLAFFGAITASVSHELNNVISIVNQTAGLLDDLLIGAREGRPIKNERLERMAESFKNQTDRGVGIIRRLNKFAHSADEPLREYDINEVAENLIALTRRLANLKKAELEFRPADHPVNLVGNPFLAQQVLFLAIRLALRTVHDEDTICVEMNEQDDFLRINIRGVRHCSDGEFDLCYLELLMSRIGGTIVTKAEEENVIFEISIPYGK
jgi:C4-dicarboxylate-specific signal transduction histidine kinase